MRMIPGPRALPSPWVVAAGVTAGAAALGEIVAGPLAPAVGIGGQAVTAALAVQAAARVAGVHAADATPRELVKEALRRMPSRQDGAARTMLRLWCGLRPSLPAIGRCLLRGTSRHTVGLATAWVPALDVALRIGLALGAAVEAASTVAAVERESLRVCAAWAALPAPIPLHARSHAAPLRIAGRALAA